MLGANQCLDNLVGGFHRHSTEIGHKVSALSVTGKTTFYKRGQHKLEISCDVSDMPTRAALGIFASKRKQIATVAAPVRGDVGEAFESVGNAVVDFLLVRIGLVVGFADTLGDNLGVTLAVAGVLAVRTLHTGSILEEFSTQCTSHNVVKLLGDELMTLLLVNLLLLLTHGTLTVKTNIKGTAVLQLFGYIQLAHGAAYFGVDPS